VVDPRVSARLVRACLRYLKDRVGPSPFEAVARGLPASAAELAVAPLQRTDLVRVVDFVALVDALEERFGDSTTHRLLREMTRTTMAAALSTVWGTFLADATPESMLGRAGTLWALSYDTGRLEVIDRGPRRARLAIAGWDDPPETVSVLVAESCAVIVARLGVGVPRAVESRAGGRVEIEVSWDAA
jgi:hypothetical protein